MLAQGALRQAILDQQCVGNDGAVAEALLPHIQLLSFNSGEKLMEQGAGDNHIMFVLYSSGERPLDTGPEVIGLIRFSALVIRPIE